MERDEAYEILEGQEEEVSHAEEDSIRAHGHPDFCCCQTSWCLSSECNVNREMILSKRADFL